MVRERGNEFFQEKDYRTALVFYTKCVEMSDDRERHLALGNRALTKIHLRDFAGAVKDCDAALKLQVRCRWGGVAVLQSAVP